MAAEGLMHVPQFEMTDDYASIRRESPTVVYRLYVSSIWYGGDNARTAKAVV